MFITIDGLLKICAVISCVGLALGYLLKAVKALRSPADNMTKKLKRHDELFANDKARLDNLEHMVADMRECMMLLLESEMATLGHLEDGNHTKMLMEKKEKIAKYLYEHAVNGGVRNENLT